MFETGSKNANTSSVKNFLIYAKNHRIPIHAETRKIGIVATLIGWACISYVEVALPAPKESFTFIFNFLFGFLGGTVCLFFASLFLGKSFLTIKNSTESKIEDQTQQITHLSASERWRLIFWRGLIAILGYLLFSWSKSNTKVIDNSAAFGTDAIMYALIMKYILKIKVSSSQWAVLGIIFLGVCFMVSFDLFGEGPIGRNILSLTVALISAACLAIIILLNTVIIQHDPPLRVAFYQCLIGFIIAALFAGIWLAFDPSALLLINKNLIVSSLISGVTYAIALIFFFNAFLYTEAFLIVIMGYSVFPFVMLFSWIDGQEISVLDFIGSTLITIGSLFSVLLQLKEDKENIHASVAGYPVYLSTLKEKFRALKKDFLRGRLGSLEYMAQRHEFNKLLFEYAHEIKTSEIEKIEIEKGEVIFLLKPFSFKMLSDGGCRSAPLEILNFGSYEKKESFFVLQMVSDGDTVLDIGANVGWYSIQLAKKFKNAVIHAFEPIPQTFLILEKNIKLNDVKNITLHQLALGAQAGQTNFYYFQGGSAVASRVNLLDHKTAIKVECEISTLDLFVENLDLSKVDFIKCDVEGSELDLIKGGRQTIDKFSPIIYIELFHGWCERFGYVPNDVLRFLKDLDYQCFEIHENFLKKIDSIEETTNNYNFFFMSQKKHAALIAKFSETG